MPWDKEALWDLLRYGSKHDGSWSDGGDIPSEDDAEAICNAEAEVARLRAKVEELRRQRDDILTEAEKRMVSELVHPISLSHVLDVLRDLRAALNDARKGEEE